MPKFWNEEKATTAVKMYDPDRSDETVEAIMEALGASKRQVVGKLVSEKVYQAPEKPAPKKKDDGPTKGELLTRLEKAGFSPDGLDNANKDAIKRLIAFVEAHPAE